jgi:hypothetical protein
MTVSDVNDNVPEWSMVPVPYLAVVSPDAVPGSLVYQLLARDDDGGDNGEVEFFLSDGKELTGSAAKVAPKTEQTQTQSSPFSGKGPPLITVSESQRDSRVAFNATT